MHMLCPQQASMKEYHRPGLTTEIIHKSVLNLTVIGEESTRTVLKIQWLLRHDGCCLKSLAHCPDMNSKQLLSLLA